MCACVCVCVCVMSRSFIVTGSVLWMPSLVPGEGERKRASEGGRWIYFSRSVVYLGLSVVAAVHYGRRCVCLCVCVCVCVCLVFGSSCKSELASTRLMYNSKDAEGRSTHTHTVVCPWLDYFVGVVVRYRFFFFLANSELPDFLVKVPGVNEFQDYFKGSWCSFSGVREH